MSTSAVPNGLLSVAEALIASGLSVIPVLTTKAPAGNLLPLDTKGEATWLPFQKRVPTAGELHNWFGPAAGVGIVGGSVSGGLTILDFDIRDGICLFDAFSEEVEGLLPGLMARFPVVRSQSGGKHLYFRCTECGGSIPQAKTKTKQSWIDCKAQGGYCVAPRSPGYQTLAGSVLNIPTITPEERALLLTVARSFDASPPPEAHDPDSLPGAAYNVRASLDDMQALLTEAGWGVVKSRHDGTRTLRRPGKSDGQSATLGQGGHKTLYVFSSSAAPFEENGHYTPFALYAYLKHSGNFSAAATQLAREGYGGKSAQAKASPLKLVEPLEQAPPSESAAPDGNGNDPAVRRYEHTDLGNGERFADTYRGQLTFARYGQDTGSWREWEGTRWLASAQDELVARAGQLTKNLAQEGLTAWDTDEGKALLKHAIKSQSEGRLIAMVNMAKNSLGSYAHEYDVDPWLLNCPNGTLDLSSGRLRTHTPTDLISKTTNVAYDPTALCPTWDAFLEQIMPDAEVRAFLQLAAGYSLTGSTREQCLFFCHGTGKNGKSTFLNALRHITGDYATTTRTETFMVKKTDGGASSDVADLLGARIVTASEPDEGKRIAESLLKEMTGQDALKARFLYKEFFNFTPSFKIWFMANHKPTIRGTDDGIWRRIRLIPFTVQIPPASMDKKLPEKLQAEAQGILRWAAEGCALWLESGLTVPAAIEQATTGYRREMDVLASFLEERCETDSTEKAIKANVYAVYRSWAKDAEEYLMSHSMFSRRMIERGFEEVRDQHARYWMGLRLRVERKAPPDFGDDGF